MNARHAVLAGAALWAAAAAAAPPMTLGDTLKLAYLHNPVIGKERARLAATRTGVTKAVAGAEPTIEFDGVLSVGKDVVTGGTPLENQLLRSSVPKRSYDVVIDQPVFESGRTLASLRSAIASVRSEAFKLASVEQDTLLHAAEDYLDVLRDQLDVALTSQSAELATRLLDGVRERQSKQDASQIDILTAQATMDEALANEANARAKLADDEGAFLRDVGSDAAELAAPSLALQVPRTEEEAVGRATTNPDILAAQYAARSSRADIDVARSAGRPSAELEADFHRRDDAVFVGEREHVRSLALKIHVPLFSGGAVRADVDAKEALAKEDDYALIDARQQVEAKARGAYRQLAHLAATRERYHASVLAKTLLVTGQTRLLALAEGSDSDILTARRTLLDAQREENDANHDEMIARIDLCRAMGELTLRAFGLDLEDPDLIVSPRKLIRDGISIPFVR